MAKAKNNADNPAPTVTTVPVGQQDQNEPSAVFGNPPIVNANQAEDLPPNPPRIETTEVPPNPPRAPAMEPRGMASASTPTSIPSHDGRFVYQPEFGLALDLDEAQCREIDRIAEQILMSDPRTAVEPKLAGKDAYERAVAIVTQARDAGREHVSNKNRALSERQAEGEVAREERRQAAYRGLDVHANPRAYAKDPNDPADQGPKEPEPIDWRAIQDEEGRRVGAFPAHA